MTAYASALVGNYLRMDLSFHLDKLVSPFFRLLKYSSVIDEYLKMLNRKHFFQKLFVDVKPSYVIFWTVIQENNFENRDELIEMEIALHNNNPDLLFEFNILEEDDARLSQIPSNALALE